MNCRNDLQRDFLLKKVFCFYMKKHFDIFLHEETFLAEVSISRNIPKEEMTANYVVRAGKSVFNKVRLKIKI